MMVKKRLRGRGSALAGTLLLALGIGAGGAHAQMQAVDPGIPYPDSLLSGPDGAMWVAGDSGSDTDVARIVTPERVDKVRLDVAAGALGAGPMVAQADGGVALLGGRRSSTDARQALASVRPDAAPRIVRLPDSAGVRGASAIGPDGSVWFARSCEDLLGRVTPAGRVVRHRLPGIGCGHVDERAGVEQASVIRLGSDGSTWLVNRCQGRIARLQRDGRVAQWRLKPICHEDPRTEVQRPSRALAEPGGGLRVERARVTVRGVLQVGAGIEVPDILTADGSEWRAARGATEVVRRAPDGQEQRIPVAEPGGRIARATAAPGGGIAVAVVRPVPGRPTSGEAMDLVVVGGDGVRSRTELTPILLSEDESGDWLTAGPDGAIWALHRYWYTASGELRSLLRVPDLADPPRPRATLARVLQRDGARIWLQVSCTAPTGTLCNGTVALRRRGGGSLLRANPRYVAAGGMPVTVSAQMTRSARRTLLRGRALPARATVTARDVTTTRNLRIVR